MAYQQLVYQDWSKGLAGTGEIDFGTGYAPFFGWVGQVAESFKILAPGHWVFQIRRGMHYALDPKSEASRLMGGRELTADDVVWNIWRLHFDPRFPNSGPRRSIPRVVAALEVEKTGPWEVTLKTPADPFTAFFWIHSGGCSTMMYAREVVERYGDANDWRRVVGTGPWMWTEYVPASIATFTRNPNYWETNPVGAGKGDRLPYPDTLRLLILPDMSTNMAAFRTGKLDWIDSLPDIDFERELRRNPELQYKNILRGAQSFNFWTSKPPFNDVRVRQALMMATDFESIVRDLYGGKGEWLVYPMSPTWKNMYVPYKELPESVQAIYRFNPERAKQLLAEAGYPGGFKAKLHIWNASDVVDLGSIFKAMWAKVGVDLELQLREYETHRQISAAYAWDDMILNWTTVGDSFFGNYSFRGMTNPTIPGQVWYDKVIEEAFNQTQKYVFVDFAKADEIYRKLVPHVMEQAISLPIPAPYAYRVWHPWLKNYHGEIFLRLSDKYVWIDQDLKKSMGY